MNVHWRQFYNPLSKADITNFCQNSNWLARFIARDHGAGWVGEGKQTDESKVKFSFFLHGKWKCILLKTRWKITVVRVELLK